MSEINFMLHFEDDEAMHFKLHPVSQKKTCVSESDSIKFPEALGFFRSSSCEGITSTLK